MVSLYEVITSGRPTFSIYRNNELLNRWDAAMAARGIMKGVLVGILTALFGWLLFSLVRYLPLRAEISLSHVLAQYAQKIFWSLERFYTLLVFPAVYGTVGYFAALRDNHGRRIAG